MGEILEEINCRSNIQKQTTFLKTFEKFQVTLKIASFNFLASDSREQVQLKRVTVFSGQKSNFALNFFGQVDSIDP